MKKDWLKVIHDTHRDMMRSVSDNFGDLITDDEWIEIDTKTYEIIMNQVLISQKRKVEK